MENETKKVGRVRWVKRGAYTVGGIVLFLIAFIWLGNHMDDILRWKENRDSRAYDAMIQKDLDTIRKMEMADTYGSTTPEGTAMLIISALESGDLVLASKYYYVLDQEKALASFQKQLAGKGNLNIAISFFKDILRGTKGCNEAGDGCTLEYEYVTEEDEYIVLPNNPTPQLFPKGSNDVMANSFKKNRFSGFWKAVKR